MEKQLSAILKRLDTIEHRLKKLEGGSSGDTKRKVIIRKQSPTSGTKNIKIKSGNIMLTKHPNGCIITGDTFDKKDIIKKYKGWWTPEVKGWTVRIEHHKKIKVDLEKASKSLEEKTDSNNLSIETNFKEDSRKTNKTPSKGDNNGFISDSD
jgi:hypothetical protein